MRDGRALECNQRKTKLIGSTDSTSSLFCEEGDSIEFVSVIGSVTLQSGASFSFKENSGEQEQVPPNFILVELRIK